MGILRKLTLCLLALPLTLNGLWILCQDMPPQAQTQESAQSQSAVDEAQAECARLCARQSSLCLISPGDKTSISIVVFGVAVFPSDVRVSSPVASREFVAELRNLHSDPSIEYPSPPPESLT